MSIRDFFPAGMLRSSRQVSTNFDVSLTLKLRLGVRGSGGGREEEEEKEKGEELNSKFEAQKWSIFQKF